MIRYLRGYVTIKIYGAEPLRTLNALAAQKIDFQKTKRPDALTVICNILKKDVPKAERIALRTMNTVTVLEEKSAARTFGGLRRRLVLLVGTVLAVVLALLLQNFVWTVEVEGNTEIPTRQLLQQLGEVGVKFGAWGPSFDQQQLKAQMMNRVGKLAWIAVNRRGGKVTVSVTEREPDAENLDRRVFTNLIAARPGILTTVDVYNGFAQVQTGDAVVTGQLLVSGMADWTTHTQITRSLGEIFALTLHQDSFVLPAQTAKKCYTGKEFRQVSLLLGRKRIKISGNSRIFYPSCDKMITRKVCTLPGGYEFPLIVETVTYRQYTLQEEKLPEQTAQALLHSFAEAYVQGQMVAGTILSHKDTLQEENGIYRYTADIFCEEMIARVRSGEWNKEVTDGTDDQCGAY